MMYFDQAATSLLKPPQVADAVYQAILHMGNTGRGSYDASLGAARMIYETRELLADFFGAEEPEQVVFTANATMALNIMLQGAFAPGEHIITTVCEHNSVLRPLYAQEAAAGIELSIIGCDQQGIIDYQAMEAAVSDHTRAIVCTHASNLTGNVTDLKRVAEICRKNGLLCMVDASQSAGTLPIDMKADGIDVLCFTGHKGLFGPQGTGGLCLRKGLTLRPLISGGSGVQTYHKEQPLEMPVHLEAGTLNGHGIAGLRAGLLYIQQTGLEQIHQQQMRLCQQFIRGVQDISGIQLYGDLSAAERTAIVSLNIGEEDSAIVGDWLEHSCQMAVRTGGHCAPLLHEAMGTKAQGMVRFSFSHFNTEQEIEAAIAALHRFADGE